jgi:hypothetical protein
MGIFQTSVPINHKDLSTRELRVLKNEKRLIIICQNLQLFQFTIIIINIISIRRGNPPWLPWADTEVRPYLLRKISIFNILELYLI